MDIFPPGSCRQFVVMSSFCSKWVCKIQCKLEAKYSSSYVQSHHCEGSFFKSGVCVCELCYKKNQYVYQGTDVRCIIEDKIMRLLHFIEQFSEIILLAFVSIVLGSTCYQIAFLLGRYLKYLILGTTYFQVSSQYIEIKQMPSMFCVRLFSVNPSLLFVQNISVSAVACGR